MFRLHGLCLGEMLVPLWHIQTIEPRFLCRITFWSTIRTGIVEEQNVRGNRSVRCKDTARQTDNGVQVEIPEQLCLNGNLCVICSKKETIRNNDSSTAIFLQAIHDKHHEEISSLATAHIRRKVRFHVGLFITSVGWIHQNNIKLVSVCIVENILCKRVVVIYQWRVNTMQQQVCHT